jgi:lipoprotein-releasing system permease protein
MWFELALARRYLRSPGRGLAKITSRLAVIGIAFGVAAMIFALALSRGFREEVQEKLLANTPHILINKADGSGIENLELIKNELSKIDGIRNLTAATYENGLLITAQSNTYTVLRAREEIQPERNGKCIAASFGAELANKTGLKAGDMPDAVFGVDKERDEEGNAKRICLIVRDTFSTGLYEYDSTRINLSLDDLLRVTKDRPATLEVSVNDIYASKIIAGKIKEKLGPDFKVLDWQEANKPFFAAMSFERRIVLIIISLIILLSILNITFTLALGVTQRRQDIAIMRTAGAKTSKIIKIFLFEGMLLGMAGIFCGAILGVTACLTANYFDLISLPAEVYVIGKIVLRPDPAEILLIVLFTFLFILAAAIYPAYSAAKVKPWENLMRG